MCPWARLDVNESAREHGVWVRSHPWALFDGECVLVYRILDELGKREPGSTQIGEWRIFFRPGGRDERAIPASVLKWAYEKISQGQNLTMSDCLAEFRPVFESDSCNFRALGGIFEQLGYAKYRRDAIIAKGNEIPDDSQSTTKKKKGLSRNSGAFRVTRIKTRPKITSIGAPDKPVDVNVESKRAKRPEQRSPAVAFRLPKGGTYPSTEYDVDATGWFPWPRISVRGGSGNMPPLSSPFKGIFSRHGYRVGQNGRVKSVREKILDQIFHEELSHENNAYKDQFGDPESHTLLKKMADFLASQAGNLARKNNPANDLAIEHYKMDLDYLYEEYYVKFGFDKGPESQRSDKGTEIAPQKPKSGVNDSKSTKPAPPEESDGPEAPPVERQEPPTTHEDNGEVPPASSPTPPDGDTIAPCPNTPPPPTSVLKRFFRWLRKTVNSILGRRA